MVDFSDWTPALTDAERARLPNWHTVWEKNKGTDPEDPRNSSAPKDAKLDAQALVGIYMYINIFIYI